MISDERRRHARVKVAIPVMWGTVPNCGFEGVITILSLGGCLIRAPLYAPTGQAVFDYGDQYTSDNGLEERH